MQLLSASALAWDVAFWRPLEVIALLGMSAAEKADIQIRFLALELDQRVSSPGMEGEN
jgi:hypothetical protein